MSERQPLLPQGQDQSILERVERWTSTLTRKTLIFIVAIASAAAALVLIGLISTFSSISPKPEINYEVLSREIDNLRVSFGIKGVAIGVVRDGKLEFGKGFGVRNEQGDKVDTDTIFEIGSNTKLFTSFGIALLAQEGLLSYSTPVSNLTEIEFKDPVTTDQANLVDLLSHRTGVPRHEYFWSWGVPEMFKRLKYLRPNAQFREKYQYSNIMFTVAGTIAGKAYGKGWHPLIRERILTPLGMTRTFTRFVEAQNQTNVASGYTSGIDGHLPVPPKASLDLQKIAPAGSISSSVNDLAKWAALLQKRGYWPEKNITLASENFAKIIRQYSPIEAYEIAFPDKTGFDWLEKAKNVTRDQTNGLDAQAQAFREMRKTGPEPSRPIHDFIGNYTNQAYGDLEVFAPPQNSGDASVLHARFREMIGGPYLHLQHWVNDSFGIFADDFLRVTRLPGSRWADVPFDLLDFEIGNGTILAKLTVEPGFSKEVFERVLS
ncbi:hypothetical protein HDU96_011140 [Phlyctochytrium bullatum]|nr:hypothetical protein HDU96_011140 [Phlyctochytrium bullatum]